MLTVIVSKIERFEMLESYDKFLQKHSKPCFIGKSNDETGLLRISSLEAHDFDLTECCEIDEEIDPAKNL